MKNAVLHFLETW